MSLILPVRRARAWLRRETSGGILLMVAAIIALAWANSPWRATYRALTDAVVGPSSWNLDLTLTHWAADGLLTVFFFVVGLELKHEARVGSLRDPRQAAVPMLAAVGGMVVPAALFTAVTLTGGAGDGAHGWGIPMATDIAFALAVFAVLGRGLPLALRTFLLTLAVVDDLLAIAVIAIFYAAELHLLYLVGVALVLVLFRWAATRRRLRASTLVPLALLAWYLMHQSGVHETVAGVMLGFCVPALPRDGETEGRAENLSSRFDVVSSGIALPVFAFLTAGVTVIGEVNRMLSSPITHGVVAGLVLGKVVGVLGTTALVTRLTPLRLPQGIGLRDLLPIGLLAGIGFTVSLLVTELSYDDPASLASAKAAVLAASITAAVLGAATLRWDARLSRTRDMNCDGLLDGTPLVKD
ncbi:sodium:proton antiporter [Aeromicrobium sp. Root495]|uniref:Na+/H+ antiporter NhaA n=1 Tax=Aeromicrobium sp. Root495 TaxID=1736550 RepID=UPI0006F622CE|nr:Na+/H+ antiporter NhaA [Aeromicrobium sp. Root495]KQY55828.1 sodium:proton antiporter [Aeromicrobium sp. Root495]